jgi:TatD DNase family protein
MRFIDSHAHLADPAFDADRGAVIQRARVAGGEAIICIGESIEIAQRARALADSQPGYVYFTAGVHPHDAVTFDAPNDIPRLEQLVTEGACAIGECGLDYHYENSPRDAQRQALDAQIALAARSALPVVVHTRDAEDDTRVAIGTAAAKGVIGVLHCFTGSQALAQIGLDAGWYVSFSGIITFRSWKDEELLRLIPDDRLLTESDAPYLAPVPNRGKRNEPAWVAHTVSRLASVRGRSVEEIASLVVANARRFFALERLDGGALHRRAL